MDGLQQDGRQPLQLFVAGIDLESPGLQGGDTEQRLAPPFSVNDGVADDLPSLGGCSKRADGGDILCLA